VVKTFRGILADLGQDRIRLSTIKGKVGYRIFKFEIFPNLPGTQSFENLVQIWKTSQSTVTAIVDFTDSDMLGVAYHENSNAIGESSSQSVTIFDNEIFNQDIYITNNDVNTTGGQPINYYIELEVIPLDDAGAEYTTLKDMRQP